MNIDKIIDVIDIGSYPSHLLEYLSHFTDRFTQYESIEDKNFNYDFGDKALDLIKDYNIIAYHYTKEILAGYFKANGLRCLSFDEHKERVIQAVKHQLSSSGIEQLQALQCPNDVDNGKLWFVYDFDQDDAGDLSKYFGGECIYGQITDGHCHNEISDVLESTGTPVVVKFYTGIKTIKYCSAIDTIVSMYAKTINTNFRIVHRQDHTEQKISPGQILSVQKLKL